VSGVWLVGILLLIFNCYYDNRSIGYQLLMVIIFGIPRFIEVGLHFGALSIALPVEL